MVEKDYFYDIFRLRIFGLKLKFMKNYICLFVLSEYIFIVKICYFFIENFIIQFFVDFLLWFFFDFNGLNYEYKFFIMKNKFFYMNNLNLFLFLVIVYLYIYIKVCFYYYIIL